MKIAILSHTAVFVAALLSGYLLKGEKVAAPAVVRAPSALAAVPRPAAAALPTAVPPPASGKPGALNQWLASLQEANTPEKLQELLKTALAEQKQGMDRELELLLLARFFGGSAPEMFLSEFDFSDPVAAVPKYVVECMEHWAKDDPLRAFDMVRALPGGLAQTRMFSGVVAGTTLKDPEQGLQFVNNSPAKMRADTAKAWAASLAQSGNLDQWCGTIQSQAAEDPQKATEPYAALVRQAATTNPELAGAMLSSMPPEMFASKSTETRWIRDVVDNWATRDPNSLGKWLENQRSTVFYDPLVAVFVERIYNVDRQSSEAWYRTIKDPSVRERMASRFPAPQ